MRYLIRCKRASLEEMTGRTWIMVVTLIAVLVTLGPMAFHFLQSELGGSVHTVSSKFSFQNMIS